MKRPAKVRFTTPPRVRHEPPTLDEAIVAARGIAEEAEQQIDIAVALIGMPRDVVAARFAELPPERPQAAMLRPASNERRSVVVEQRSNGRALVVERRAKVSLRHMPMR